MNLRPKAYTTNRAKTFAAKKFERTIVVVGDWHSCVVVARANKCVFYMSLYKALDRLQSARRIERSEHATSLATSLAAQFNQSAAQLRYAPQNKFTKQETSQATSLNSVNQLLKRASKFSNPAYLAAIDQRKTDESQWRMQRILKRLRSQYGTDRYSQLLKAISQMDSGEIENFVRALDSSW